MICKLKAKTYRKSRKKGINRIRISKIRKKNNSLSKTYQVNDKIRRSTSNPLCNDLFGLFIKLDQ